MSSSQEISGPTEIRPYDILKGRGRPPKYTSVKSFREKAFEYFKAAHEHAATRVTITGFCLYMGFSSRQSFYDYEKKKKNKDGTDTEFSYTIKIVRLIIENHYEQQLQWGKNYSAGAIFALKNFGWVDKTEVGMTDKEGKDVFQFPSSLKVDFTGNYPQPINDEQDIPDVDG